MWGAPEPLGVSRLHYASALRGYKFHAHGGATTAAPVLGYGRSLQSDPQGFDASTPRLSSPRDVFIGKARFLHFTGANTRQMGDTMRNLARLTLVALALLTAPSAVRAQATLGPAIAYHDDFKLGIGAALNVPIQEFGRGVAILTDFVYFFPDGDLNYLEINGNLTYSFGLPDAIMSPYILAGLNVSNLSTDVVDSGSTELGFNLGGGAYFAMGSFRPNIGLKIEIGGGSGFVVFAHLPFVIGQ